MKNRLLTTILVCAFAFCVSAQTVTRQTHSNVDNRRSDSDMNIIQRNIVQWRDGQHIGGRQTVVQHTAAQHRDVWCDDARIGARPFTRYSIGLNAGTYGGGLWVGTNLGNHFALRAGFTYLGVEFRTDLEASMAAYFRNNPGQQLPNEVNVNFINPQWEMSHGSLKIGWTPARNGIFSLQAGAYVGHFDFIVAGRANHPNPENIYFRFADKELRPQENGTFHGRLRMGNLVKPYFGIGLGRTIPRSRVGFKFDLGATYQGPMRFISEQATIPDIGQEIHSDYIPDGLELIGTIAEWARFWPVMNFSLTVRLN